MITKIKFILVLTLLCYGKIGLAQTDTTNIYRITLIDESEFFGTIESENDSLIAFKTNAGLELSLVKKMIKEKKIIQGEWSGTAFLRADPNSTRLLFAPTGRTLKSGNGYFSAYEIFFTFWQLE
jgi:hypothetical protein